MNRSNPNPAHLKLANGLIFNGFSFGYDQAVSGEVVFSTAMVGYPESLTDPAYRGEILSLTYPIVGNYGIPPSSEIVDGVSSYFNSNKIQAKGLVLLDYSNQYSHWNGIKSLDEWLEEHKVSAIWGVDSRELAQVLRDEGSIRGAIVPMGCEEPPLIDIEAINYVAQVSTQKVLHYGSGSKKVVLVDCGVKDSLIRNLLQQGIEIIRTPWDFNFNTIESDAVIIAGGPGSPLHCRETIEHIKSAIESNPSKPLLGLSLGGVMVAIAAGAIPFKMKRPHRGSNQPVQLHGSSRAYITYQNHGWGVDDSTIEKGWERYFTNLNDLSCEGVKHLQKPFYALLFYPEVESAPTDTQFILENFCNLL